MLGKLFGKKTMPTEEVIYSPVNGRVVNIEEVQDPTFSQKMMGDGIAVKPTDGKVVSPVNGEVMQVFPTKHAVGIKGESGIEILIHIGLETVGMNGEGFESHVKAGAKVKVGQPLITFDLERVNQKAVDDVIPVVITNMDHVETLDKQYSESANAGATAILTVKTKH